MKHKIISLFIVTSFLVGAGLVSSASDILITNEKLKEEAYGLYNIEINGDILKLDISYGGCVRLQSQELQQKFNLVWNGEYLKSIPPQVNLYLAGGVESDGKKITCAVLWDGTLEFDLKKLRKAGEKSVIINFFRHSSYSEPQYKLDYNYGGELSNNTGICPADLRICPDGTSVGRELPNCEFEKCPSSNEECEVIGLRKDGKYCSSDKVFLTQKSPEESCDNNFECESNVCAGEKCVSSSLIQKIIAFFKRLFGFD